MFDEQWGDSGSKVNVELDCEYTELSFIVWLESFIASSATGFSSEGHKYSLELLSDEHKEMSESDSDSELPLYSFNICWLRNELGLVDAMGDPSLLSGLAAASLYSSTNFRPLMRFFLQDSRFHLVVGSPLEFPGLLHLRPLKNCHATTDKKKLCFDLPEISLRHRFYIDKCCAQKTQIHNSQTVHKQFIAWFYLLSNSQLHNAAITWKVIFTIGTTIGINQTHRPK